ncbi:hypothetical protein ACJMK2_040548 [Sinanodonta woodiana]|uniref:Uncharacterized protein n=1 Tax=Sinanodonta woodiana TaxID=1069815 RepID=A0ABD3W1C0_SINWO
MASANDSKWQKDVADQNFDYMFKLLIIGNSSVGKTSFLFRYADDSFTSAFVSTVGIDFKVKTVFRQDKRVKLQIWVSEIVYMTWRCTQIKSHAWSSAYIWLVGNKCDLDDLREVTTAQGQELAQHLGEMLVTRNRKHFKPLGAPMLIDVKCEKIKSFD